MLPSPKSTPHGRALHSSRSCDDWVSTEGQYLKGKRLTNTVCEIVSV